MISMFTNKNTLNHFQFKKLFQLNYFHIKVYVSIIFCISHCFSLLVKIFSLKEQFISLFFFSTNNISYLPKILLLRLPSIKTLKKINLCFFTRIVLIKPDTTNKWTICFFLSIYCYNGR